MGEEKRKKLEEEKKQLKDSVETCLGMLLVRTYVNETLP